ncbi:hypothetical protein [Jannaschia aquimarina]|uniref:Uncharacterized protein n=1 Tax=Jannaschia aquimarina TaxID=935700 RepID=A0A0D1EP58_9RHOB|nr:hypothetical protein [Jannaschia aquimarina]KIT17435.1 hypothetical protein jaqu_08500 [Jannaschia aquimarina]SNT23863.1 hypothetical protein SAMN05421775_108152 [Jannaschia aquimarina]
MKGQVLDAYPVDGRGTVIRFRLAGREISRTGSHHVDWAALPDAPAPGDPIRVAGQGGRVLALDENGIRVRACLTGRPIAPEGTVLTDLPPLTKDAFGADVTIGTDMEGS